MSSLVYSKHPRGITYVYKNESYWDKVEKKTKHKRTCIGKLDPVTNEIIPTRKKVAKVAKVEKTEVTDECTVTSIGPALILDKAVRETGIGNALKLVFPEDWDKILACAYFLVCENRALSHMEQWSQEYRTPYGKQMTSQRISELLERITPSLQQTFFLQWIKSNHTKSNFAMDVTSVSSYSELIDFVRKGYNRDGETLEQVNLLMITSEQNKLPIYYRLYSGSINDVKTLKESLSTLELMRSKPLSVVMDKGFYSDKNIDELYANHYKFTVGVPFTCAFAREEVRKLKDKIVLPQNLLEINTDNVFAYTELIKWNGHRCYVHVYYDNLKQASDVQKFYVKLKDCYNELYEHKEDKRHQKFYDEYFIVKDHPKRGRQISYNDKASINYKDNIAGWFVMISNCIKDTKDALYIYRYKDVVEKNFDDLKNALDMKRLRMHSNKTMEGRIFLQFIALILFTYLRNYNEANSSKYKIPEIFSELNTYREVSVEGRRKKSRTTLSKALREIFDLFHISDKNLCMITGI